MKALVILILLTLSLSANALYKCTLPGGKLVYSQTMCEGDITYMKVKKQGVVTVNKTTGATDKQEKHQMKVEAKSPAEAERKLKLEHEMDEFRKINKN